MIYGGQTNSDDFHFTGFDRAIMQQYLEGAGFCEITPRDDFGLFEDGSRMAFKGVSVSLNLVAKACKEGGPQAEVRHVPAAA